MWNFYNILTWALIVAMPLGILGLYYLDFGPKGPSR
jgi:hypothetical protein